MSESRTQEAQEKKVFATREVVEANVIYKIRKITIQFWLEGKRNEINFYCPAMVGKRKDVDDLLRQTLSHLVNSPLRDAITHKKTWWMPWCEEREDGIYPVLFSHEPGGNKNILEFQDDRKLNSSGSLDTASLYEKLTLSQISDKGYGVPEWITQTIYDHNSLSLSTLRDIASKKEMKQDSNEQMTSADQMKQILHAIREGIRTYESMGTRKGENLRENIEKFKVTITDGSELCFAKYRNEKLAFPEIDLPFFELQHIINQLFDNVNDGVFKDSSKALCLYDSLKEVIKLNKQDGLAHKHIYRFGALPRLSIVGDEIQIERKPNKSHSKSWSGSSSSNLSSRSSSSSSHSSSRSDSPIHYSLRRISKPVFPPKFLYSGIANSDDCKIQLENAKRCVLDAIIKAYGLYNDEGKENIRAVMTTALFSRQTTPPLLQNQLFDFKHFNALTITNIEHLLGNLLKALKKNPDTLLAHLTGLTVNNEKKRVLVHNNQKEKYLFDLPKMIMNLESPAAQSEKEIQKELDNQKMMEETRNLALVKIQTLKKGLVKFSKNESEVELLCKAEEVALHNHLSYIEKLPDWQIPLEYTKLQESYNSFQLDKVNSRRAANYFRTYLHLKKLQKESHIVTYDPCLTHLIADALDPGKRASLNQEIKKLTIEIEIEKMKDAIQQPENNALGSLLNYTRPVIALADSDIAHSNPIAIPVASHSIELSDEMSDPVYSANTAAMLLEQHANIIDQLREARVSFGQVDKSITHADHQFLSKMIPLKEFVSSDFDKEKYIKYRTLLKPFLLLAQTRDKEKISQIDNLLAKVGILDEFVILGREIDQAKQKIRGITKPQDGDSTAIMYAKSKLRVSFQKIVKKKHAELNQSINTINQSLSRIMADEGTLEENLIIVNDVVDEAILHKDEFAKYRQSVADFFNYLDAIFLKFEREGALSGRKSNKRKWIDESKTDNEFTRPPKKARLLNFFSDNSMMDERHENDLNPEDEEINYFNGLVNDLNAMKKLLQRAEDTLKKYSSCDENNGIPAWARLTLYDRQLYFENAYVTLRDKIDKFKRIINNSVVLDAQQEIVLKQLMKGIFVAQAKLAKRSRAFKIFMNDKAPVDKEQQLLNTLYFEIKKLINKAIQNKHIFECPIALPNTKSPIAQAGILNKIHIWAEEECARVNVNLQGINQFDDCKTWDKLQDWHTRECLQIFHQLTDDRPKQRAIAFNCKIKPTCIPPAVDEPIWANIGGYASGSGLMWGGAGLTGLGVLLLPLGGIGIGLIAVGAAFALLGIGVMGANAALGEKKIVHADFEKVWQRSDFTPENNNTALYKKLTRVAAEPPKHTQVRRAGQPSHKELPHKSTSFIPAYASRDTLVQPGSPVPDPESGRRFLAVAK